LYGRERDLGVLNDLTDRLGEGGGGALVVRGEAGIGKSALLATVSSSATDKGVLVVATTGVQSELHLPFTDRRQLL
jgi:predicted ATPase